VTGETRLALKRLVNQHVRENLKHEPRLGVECSTACKGCGVPHADYTRGCRRCMNRHFHRRAAQRKRELA